MLHFPSGPAFAVEMQVMFAAPDVAGLHHMWHCPALSPGSCELVRILGANLGVSGTRVPICQ